VRILFLGNNWTGWQVVKWLKEQGEDIVGIVMHPREKRKHGEEIMHYATDTGRVFSATSINEQDTMRAIDDLNAEMAVSVFFGYVLCKEFLDLFPAGSINLHPSYLPFNRGAYPNVWSIVEGTTAGVTLHHMDPGVDTGDIIAQQEVRVEPTDTGESLYRKLEKSCLELFQDSWPLVRTGRAPRIRQERQSGTCHRVGDVVSIDEIDLEKEYTARYLIDVIRARTFSDCRGAYFIHRGKKIHMRLQLVSDEQD